MIPPFVKSVLVSGGYTLMHINGVQIRTASSMRIHAALRLYGPTIRCLYSYGRPYVHGRPYDISPILILVVARTCGIHSDHSLFRYK